MARSLLSKFGLPPNEIEQQCSWLGWGGCSGLFSHVPPMQYVTLGQQPIRESEPVIMLYPNQPVGGGGCTCPGGGDGCQCVSQQPGILPSGIMTTGQPPLSATLPVTINNTITRAVNWAKANPGLAVVGVLGIGYLLTRGK